MPLSPVIVPPRAQASRRCETQAPLSGKPPSCAKRFGPLTPSARSGNLIVGDGTKNGLPAPNKELAINRKQPLDRKSPIQVRIRLPPAQSQQRNMVCARLGVGRPRLVRTIAQEPKLPDDNVWPGISQRVDSGLPNAVTTTSHYEYQYGYDHHARWRGHWVLVR